MDNNEIKLILGCQNGNAEDFGKLYDKYIKKIYNFIYYKTSHKETAEDLTSLAFTKALQNIKNFNINKGYFSAWLYRIARNTVIDHYRKCKVETTIDDIYNLSSQNDIQKDIDCKNKLDEIQKHLKTLSADQREIIIMRVWDELSYREIAEITKKTEANCKMIFSRGIKKLREEIPLAILIILLLHL